MDSIPHKTCTRCKQPKPLAEFYTNARYKDGHMTWCKLCHKAYRDEHREQRTAQMREWRERLAADPAALEAERARARAYYHADEERKRRYRERMNARARTRWQADLAYRERKNRQKRESLRDRASDPVFRRKRAKWTHASNHRRRARLAAAPGRYTLAEWDALVARFGGRCACCGSVAILTVDHVMPLSRGGSNDIANIQPLCGPCNSRKFTKAVDYRSD